MDTRVISTESVPWEACAGFPDKIGVKTLRDDRHCGARTALMRIPPNSEIPAHCHRGVVQHYVIEGYCEMDGSDSGAGTYMLLPAHTRISSIRSRRGAVILLIYDPVDA